MKPIYLTHPKHGVHVAYSADEVKRCEANGWTLRQEPPAVAEPERKRGPGRPRKEART